jgi:drug/metabolite transporter (DMT)-like permease
MKSKHLTVFILLAAIWGAGFMFIRMAAPAFGAMPLSFVRVTIGALALAALALLLRKPRLTGAHLWWSLGIGLVSPALPFALFAYALQTLPAGYGSVLNATVPFWGVAIGAFYFKETIALPKLIALCVAVLGLAVMLGLGTLPVNAASIKAALACILANLIYSIAGYLSKYKLAGADSVGQSLGALVGSSVVLAPLAWWFWPAALPQASDWAAVTVLGVFCSALAYVMYFWLIASAGVIYSMSVTLLIPVFGVLAGAVFLGERLTLLSGLGGAITLIATAVVIGVLPLRKTPSLAKQS